MERTREQANGDVIVGVDGSDTGLRAVQWAAREAADRGSRVHLVHAAHYLRGPVEGDSAEVRRGRAILARAYTCAHHAAPDLLVTTDLVAGAPTRVLLSAAEKAALLVVGMIGTGAADEILLGSVALDVTGRATCPVVVVRGHDHTDQDTRPVLLGVAAGTGDDAAISIAFELAARRGVELLAVHVLHGAEERMARLAEDKHTAQELEPQLLAERLADAQRAHPGVVVRDVVRHGRPTEVLLAQAELAQLAVVGTRNRGAATRAVLGSISRNLLRHSPCPVAVVHPDVAPVQSDTHTRR